MYPPQPEDNRGAAYIFTRNGTVWTQQARISPGGNQGGAPGDQFGISVDLSGTTVIVGARTAAANDGTARAGAAYVYRLDCTPPISATVVTGATSACPGGSFSFSASSTSATGGAPTVQWRKNGIDIPGATFFNYTLINISALDAGSYDAILSSACGGALSNPVVITVSTNSINPTSQNFSASGSNGIVNFNSTGSCGWTAVSNSSF